MNTLDTAKELVALIQKVGDIELYRKTVEFQAEVVALSQKNLELQVKCSHLEAELQRRKSLRHERQLYYASGDVVPFCPTCYEKTDKYVHLFGPKSGYPQDVECYECLGCNYSYYAKGGSPFEPQPSRRKH